MAMEFVDGLQISSEGSLRSESKPGFSQSESPVYPVLPPTLPPTHPATHPATHPPSHPPTLPPQVGPPLHYTSLPLTPLRFHSCVGRNMAVAADRTAAVRAREEYCNGYVFTARPLQCGEKLIIQILSVDRSYVGGLAFGMTACDPGTLTPTDLPDDSDLLLDRPEYWIVNKDVYSNPEVGDELCFHLNTEGQVIYGRNGHEIATLMHIDKTLPMWAFFDVYGTTQKIRCIGVSDVSSATPLQVSLPPSRSQSVSPASTVSPPRPPPPRHSPSLKQATTSRQELTPPSLPPKQSRLNASPPTHGLSLPPPLIPIPASQPAGGNTQGGNTQGANTQGGNTQGGNTLTGNTPGGNTYIGQTPASQTPSTSPLIGEPAHTKPLTPDKPTDPKPTPSIPPIPPRHIDKWTRATPAIAKPAVAPSGEQTQEALDNAQNECCVCFENPPNCVVYTCGHMCMCYDCATSIRNSSKALCPICCQEIKDVIKIFRS